MTAKEYLNQARTIDKERRVKETELRLLHADAQTLQSPQWGERVKSSHLNKSMTIIDKIADMEAEIKKEINSLLDLKNEIRGKIGQLPQAEYRIVLTDYYINCLTLEQVAESNNYSVVHIKRICKKAVFTFAMQFGFPLSCDTK